MKHLIRILSLTLLVLVALSGTACSLFEENPDTPESLETPVNITVTVLHGDGETRTFPIKTDHPTLRGALEQENLVKGEDGLYGLYLHEVDGERAVFEEDGAYWAVYIGDEQAMTGVDGISLTEGGVYRLVWTKG